MIHNHKACITNVLAGNNANLPYDMLKLAAESLQEVVKRDEQILSTCEQSLRLLENRTDGQIKEELDSMSAETKACLREVEEIIQRNRKQGVLIKEGIATVLDKVGVDPEVADRVVDRTLGYVSQHLDLTNDSPSFVAREMAAKEAGAALAPYIGYESSVSLIHKRRQVLIQETKDRVTEIRERLHNNRIALEEIEGVYVLGIRSLTPESMAKNIRLVALDAGYDNPDDEDLNADVKDINTVATYIELDQFDTAEKAYRRLDTCVRDYFPIYLVDYLECRRQLAERTVEQSNT